MSQRISVKKIQNEIWAEQKGLKKFHEDPVLVKEEQDRYEKIKDIIPRFREEGFPW